jgi:hypothetical protein
VRQAHTGGKNVGAAVSRGPHSLLVHTRTASLIRRPSAGRGGLRTIEAILGLALLLLVL